MSQPRKHHFLPQLYLRKFSRTGDSLYQIEKPTGRAYGVSIKDLAAIRDFHRLDFDDVEDPQAVERELAQIEGKLSANLDLVLRNGVGEQRTVAEVIGLISLLRMRVPAVKRHIEASLGASVRTVAEAMERQGKLPTPPPGLKEALKVANLDIQIHNWKCLELMFGMAFNPDVLNIMCNMQATLFRAPEGSFVTSDQPVALFHTGRESPYGVGPATLGVEISAPLSSNCLLLLKHSSEPDENRTATAGQIVEFNRRTIVMAEQYVYASETTQTLLDSVAALRESSAGFCFDMLRAPNGTYQLLRCLPVFPADT